MPAEIIKQMIAYLDRGDFQKAANIFVIEQEKGIFPPDHTLADKLVKVIGKKETSKLIIAFSHYPCQFCKKGRVKCKDCKGHGHINHDMICEQCLGLGSVRCDFCNGSGWIAIEDVPDGLRTTVLITRAQTAITKIKSIVAKAKSQTSENKPSKTLKECAHIIIHLDKYMGVLENMIIAYEKMNIPERSYKNRINKIYQRCIEAALKGKECMQKTIERMADLSRLESKMADENSVGRKLAEKRAEFYHNIADKSDIFVSLKSEHPFLEKAIKEYTNRKH